jgi:orotate phosphoribosyltransferase
MTQVLTTKSGEEMVDLIYDTGAFLRGSFTLSSGKPSSYYFDSKLLTLNPMGSYEVGRYLFEKLKASEAESVGGMALGAIPIVGAVTLISHLEDEPLPAFFVRKEAKSHGTEKRIEGNLPAPGTPVAILDDVVTGGNSIMQAIQAAESNGNPIVAVMCILDRNEGGREYLKEEGHELQAMFTIEDGEIQFNP